MTSYEMTTKIIEEHYKNCLNFWKGDHVEALTEIAATKHNPFTPNGDLLDRQAIIDFINKTL